eukprot:gene7963-12429_t
MKSRSLFSKIIFFGAPLTATAVLGTWQVRRYNWKVNQIKERNEKLNLEPIQFSKEISDTIDPFYYRKVSLTGKFHNEDGLIILKLIYFRDEIVDKDSEKLGYNVIVPFTTTDGVTIWVNRGWEPEYKIESKERNIEGTVTIEGIIRREETTGSLVGDDIHVKNNFFLTTKPTIFQKFTSLKTTPILIDQLYEIPNFENQPYLIDVEESNRFFRITPFTHATYAFTWFGIGAYIIRTIFYLKKKKKL